MYLKKLIKIKSDCPDIVTGIAWFYEQAKRRNWCFLTSTNFLPPNIPSIVMFWDMKKDHRAYLAQLFLHNYIMIFQLSMRKYVEKYFFIIRQLLDKKQFRH